MLVEQEINIGVDMSSLPSYKKRLRQTLGDIFTNCRTERADFRYYLFDSVEDRTIGLAMRPTTPRWYDRKFDQYGIMVIHKQICRIHTTDKDEYKKANLILYSLRLAEDIDCV
jgi:hypothetical protein